MHRSNGRQAFILAGVAVALGLSACATGHQEFARSTLRGVDNPYVVNGRRYVPEVGVRHYEAVGLASWYSYPDHSRRTATGEWFDGRLMTGAHKTLPLPCMVEITNLENGKQAKVRLNDRGPFADGRLVDLSKSAADELGFARQGLVKVRVRYLGPADA